MVTGETDGTGSGPLDALVSITDYLTAHTTMTVAYADADGPQACAVQYALEPREGDGVPLLRFVSEATTRHGAAFEPGAAVAFTVQDDGQQWTSLTGIQGTGTVRVLTGPEHDAAYHHYLAAFPFVAASDPLREALARSDLFELTPTWLRLIANAHRFGHKEEWPTPR
ncbi:hypothetical protein BIV57_06915 [Mangrovactinospora gilvigrisea]|uniref:Pyridoxamine 5'-phosphate oxidase n=1 Tax=Mangrovactinospora gilvigrisea TaxID=1428644 RepID=A0A1J7BI50_9ACTN|nr:hypothetical protein [Mangrovactinospora gilvigrisea]OIV38261.1 hypothetical protein BIV57_06915 [Mangrovactinospora gilvigrisea]